MTQRKKTPGKPANPQLAGREDLTQLISARLREARRNAKLTQHELGLRIGLVGEVYGRMERGKMLPSAETLQKLSLALGVSADELLGLGREDRTIPPPPRPEEERPELRRFIRRARELDPSKLRVIAIVAKALTKTRT